MDPRRLLTAALAFALLPATSVRADDTVSPPGAPSASTPTGVMAPIPNPSRRARSALRQQAPAEGIAAIVAANRSARTASRSDRFVGGLQVFDFAPGRLYEVWTAPLRVTTLSFGPGEAVVSIAAGDTVRWQIGETASGEGVERRAHVLVKPLTRGLQTNLVLTTTRRLYFVHLRSDASTGFNTAVAWSPEPVPLVAEPPAEPPALRPAAFATEGLDAGYRITAIGRRPAWTPVSVMTDGTRTVIAFPPRMGGGEAPALFALTPDGAIATVNYRQQGDLYVVDQVLHLAELRLGDQRRPVVRLSRQEGRRR